MKTLSYEEWCEYILPKAEVNGRSFDDVVTDSDTLIFEDWKNGDRLICVTSNENVGERVKKTIQRAFLQDKDGVIKEEYAEIDYSLNISPDPRYDYDMNRTPLGMKPEYLAIGADKWKYPDPFVKRNKWDWAKSKKIEVK